MCKKVELERNFNHVSTMIKPLYVFQYTISIHINSQVILIHIKDSYSPSLPQQFMSKSCIKLPTRVGTEIHPLLESGIVIASKIRILKG